jgi:hypothetical protein
VAVGERADRQVRLVEGLVDVPLDRMEERRVQPAPGSRLLGVPRRTDGERDEVVHVYDKGMPEGVVPDGGLIPRNPDIAAQHSEGRGDARYPPQDLILRLADERGKPGSRYAQHEETAGRAVGQMERIRLGQEDRLPIAEHDLASTLRGKIRAAQVHHQRQIVGAIGEKASRAAAARTLDSPREQLDAGHRTEHDIDVKRDAI